MNEIWMKYNTATFYPQMLLKIDIHNSYKIPANPCLENLFPFCSRS